MAKVADIYFSVEPWEIVENGFNPEYATVAESIYSLGNEYMGIRGIMEEGYSGDTLVGSYFNGIYERLPQKKSYKGIVDFTEYMVNSVNWLAMDIVVDGEKLDLHTCQFAYFKRTLNLKNGVLQRSFIWKLENGKELELVFERFLCMEKEKTGAQKIAIRPINFSGAAEITMKLDFSGIHEAAGENMWDCEEGECEASFLSILGTTKNTKQQVYSCCKLSGTDVTATKEFRKEKQVGITYTIDLTEGKTSFIERIAYNLVQKEGVESEVHFAEKEAFKNALGEARSIVEGYSYEQLKEENATWWKEVWEKSDIVIEGDVQNQQGIRFCIFQMYQTYHGTKPGTNIGAKGLTGEAYNGNAFWDTETYCLPFYIFNDVKAAKNLLLFRYLTLQEAKNRAKDLDCEGAFYPIATISGKECCNLWQHASLQLQASTAVAYGVWFYTKLTQDIRFLVEYGVEMLVEISRMLATRGDFSADGTKYGYYCVMGPDEFQMMVNHNYYTNYMGRFTLNYTLEVLSKLESECPEELSKLLAKLQVKDEELVQWKKISECMYLPQDEEKGLFEQHEGFFNLPHVDVDAIPVEEFPLYHHWTYDRIYRNDMIKQPDVLMLMLLFNSQFTQEQLKANYEYYEPKCIHESSLSPSVHSILASQLGKHKEAYDFFGFATRMDLDNYNRNSNEGLHTTSISAAWMNIVYGFGGMRSDGEVLSFCPSIPENWNSYSFCVTYHDAVISVKVTQDSVMFCVKNGMDVTLKVYGKDMTISGEMTEIAIA